MTAARIIGGYIPGKLISAASTNATNVKNSKGTLGWLHVTNDNAAARYLKLYDKASAPTVGTDVPAQTFKIPATGSLNLPLPPQGCRFLLGINFALTTGSADSDTNAVSANEHVVNYGYL